MIRKVKRMNLELCYECEAFNTIDIEEAPLNELNEHFSDDGCEECHTMMLLWADGDLCEDILEIVE